MKWKDNLIKQLDEKLPNTQYWKEIIYKIETRAIGLHLAIFTEPFLSLVCQGKKTIETRFSQTRVAPFDKISEGDVILMKESGGQVKGLFIAGDIKFYTYLNEDRLKEIEVKYGPAICSQYDPNFWQGRVNANFATLIEIKEVTSIEHFDIDKNDQLGWVTLKLGLSNTLFS